MQKIALSSALAWPWKAETICWKSDHYTAYGKTLSQALIFFYPSERHLFILSNCTIESADVMWNLQYYIPETEPLRSGISCLHTAKFHLEFPYFIWDPYRFLVFSRRVCVRAWMAKEERAMGYFCNQMKY